MQIFVPLVATLLMFLPTVETPTSLAGQTVTVLDVSAAGPQNDPKQCALWKITDPVRYKKYCL